MPDDPVEFELPVDGDDIVPPLSDERQPIVIPEDGEVCDA